jgi:hypothetical protein
MRIVNTPRGENFEGLGLAMEEVVIVMEGKGKQLRRAFSSGSYRIAVPPGEYRVWLERKGAMVTAPETLKLKNGEALGHGLAFQATP